MNLLDHIGEIGIHLEDCLDQIMNFASTAIVAFIVFLKVIELEFELGVGPECACGDEFLGERVEFSR